MRSTPCAQGWTHTSFGTTSIGRINRCEGSRPNERLGGAELPTSGKSGGQPRAEPRAPPLLLVTNFRGRAHLPIVELREAA
jgi:hypothetical protein